MPRLWGGRIVRYAYACIKACGCTRYVRAYVMCVRTNVRALRTRRFRSQSRSRFSLPLPLPPLIPIGSWTSRTNGRTDGYLLCTSCYTCTCNSDGQLSSRALCESSRSTTPIGRTRLCVGRHLSSGPDPTYFELSAFFIANGGGVRENVSTKVVVRCWKRHRDICYPMSHVPSEFLRPRQGRPVISTSIN